MALTSSHQIRRAQSRVSVVADSLSWGRYPGIGGHPLCSMFARELGFELVYNEGVLICRL
jgi:hypothetical protein